MCNASKPLKAPVPFSTAATRSRVPSIWSSSAPTPPATSPTSTAPTVAMTPIVRPSTPAALYPTGSRYGSMPFGKTPMAIAMTKKARSSRLIQHCDSISTSVPPSISISNASRANTNPTRACPSSAMPCRRSRERVHTSRPLIFPNRRSYAFAPTTNGA